MTEEKKIDKANKPKKNKKPKTEKEKHTGFNVLDILIVLCVLAVLTVLFFVYSPLDMINTGSGETDVIYSIRVYGVPSDYAANVAIGDTVNDSDGCELGKVASAVEVESHLMYIFDQNSGGVKVVVHPDLVDLIITISAKAELYKDGYRVDGIRIAVERKYDLLLPAFEAEGICVSLSEENANDAGGAK